MELEVSTLAPQGPHSLDPGPMGKPTVSLKPAGGEEYAPRVTLIPYPINTSGCALFMLQDKHAVAIGAPRLTVKLVA